MKSWMSRHFWNIKNWHWISSAVCLIGMLLFAITGITLNHATSIESEASTREIESQVPSALVARLSPNTALPQAFLDWYEETTTMTLNADVPAQWSDSELYVAQPRAGGDRWFSVDLNNGDFYQQTTSRGVVSYLNDLHKGRNTGAIWKFFIDVFAVACMVFSVTGLLLLKRYAKGRKSTWPLVMAGLIIPVILLMIPAHVQADELKVTLPRINVAEYHAPYVAVWLADENEQRVKDIAVWYDTEMDNHKGEKWLKDLRLWWRRSGRSLALPVDGVSGATRRPGTATIALADTLKTVAKGQYTLYVEAARELGGREVLSIPLTLPATQPVAQKASGNNELTSIELTLEAVQ